MATCKKVPRANIRNYLSKPNISKYFVNKEVGVVKTLMLAEVDLKEDSHPVSSAHEVIKEVEGKVGQ